MSQEITHEKAVEIDTQLAELWRRSQTAVNEISSYKGTVAHAIGLKGAYIGWQHYYPEAVDQVLDLAHDKLADDETFTGYNRELTLRYLDKITEARMAYNMAREEAAPLEAIYDANPWPRFYLVTNKNGHIHSSMQCHSCGPRTLFAWLPELSGLTEKDAVDAHGTILCSHCYPSAPVEWTLGIQKEADPNQCPGSGTHDYDQDTYRRTGWNGNGRAKCTHCEQYAGVTTNYKLRKHKKAA